MCFGIWSILLVVFWRDIWCPQFFLFGQFFWLGLFIGSRLLRAIHGGPVGSAWFWFIGRLAGLGIFFFIIDVASLARGVGAAPSIFGAIDLKDALLG